MVPAVFLTFAAFLQLVVGFREQFGAIISDAMDLEVASNFIAKLDGNPARIRVVLVEGTSHPGRGDTGYYFVPLHVDYWRHAISSLTRAHQIPELSIVQGNVIIDPPAYDADMLPHELIRKLRMTPDSFSNPTSLDPIFAREHDKAKGAIKKQLQAFADSLSPGDISVFVFTGHGVQIGGELNLLFANPLFPEIKRRVPRRVWQNAGCTNALGQHVCISYDEIKQVFDGKGRLSIHIIGACRVTRDPRFNFDSSDGGDPREAREKFLIENPARRQPMNVVTLFGTAPGSRTWHGFGSDLGKSLDKEGELDSVYVNRLKDATTSPLKFTYSYFQERVIAALGTQCTAADGFRPTVFSWLSEAAKEPIERTEHGEVYRQVPELEWGLNAEAAARSTDLVFDQGLCFDRLADAGNRQSM